jgi:SAM-dependent methyltransferase
MNEVDDHRRAEEIRGILNRKRALHQLYREFYLRFLSSKEESPEGPSLKIGSGAGLLKEIIPDAITSDILPYTLVDLVMDVAKMPFADRSISSIFMLNALHHLPQTTLFFEEVTRCLVPGGRVLITDQYHWVLSKIISDISTMSPIVQMPGTGILPPLAPSPVLAGWWP